MNTELSLIDSNTDSSKNFLKLYNRSNRLISAVFLVINVVDGNDQIKNRIKELAMQLMSVCVELKDEQGANSYRLLSKIEKVVLELLSLLEVTSVSGLVSEMNASILKNEFQSFLASVTDFSEGITGSEVNTVKNVLEKNDLADFETVKIKNPNPTRSTADSASVVAKTVPNQVVIKDENKGQSRKDSRQNAILEFVRLHPSSSIKEITPHIRGCGEKTIQRELVELVRSGTMHRVGERRWSRYSVA